jgi:LPS-assembly protein
MGHDRPYFFLTDGRRMTISPEIYSPLNFKQYATLTPYATGEGAFYEAADRSSRTTDDRFSGEIGARAFTRFERAFPTSYLVTRGIKHQIEPDIEYRYRPEPEQDELPIFDGEDRLAKVSEITYGLTNRLWMRLFNAPKKKFETFKLTDLRILHGYDFAEAERQLDPTDPKDERRPWRPWRAELETLASPSDWLTKILVRSDADYDAYQGEITAFNVMTAMTTADEDGVGAEYRFHRDRYGATDINFLSGLARYTLVDFITFNYLARYSFIDSYFIEQRYGVEFHSPQHCWNVNVNYERHSIPKHEDIILLMFDFTGLSQVGTSF